MAKLRGTRFAYLTEVAAAPGFLTHDNCFRDVLPDKPFKLYGYDMYMRNQSAELLELQLYKNISASGGPVAGGPVLVTHGVLMESVLYEISIWNESVMFIEPISFDRDDSLTIAFSWGVQGAGVSSTMEIVLLWSET